jgi:hypothetical protein
MKKIILAVLLLAAATSLFPQEIEIIEESVTVNKKQVSAWVSYMSDDIDMVRKSFIRFSKDKYDLKAKRDSKRVAIIEQADLPSISDKRGDVYLVLSSDKRITKLGIVFFVGYDIPVNSRDYPEEMRRLKDFHKEFIVYYKSEYFKTLIAENQKRIKDLSSELRKSQNELKSLSRSISKAEKSISKESDEAVKFELNNQNVEARAKTQATHEIISNLKSEIERVSASLKEIKSSLNRLETGSVIER